jgi:hypothetical protein
MNTLNTQAPQQKRKTTKYFFASYSLIQDAQYNLHLLNTDKKSAFLEWLNSFNDDGIKEIDYTAKRHFSISCKEYASGNYFMKFAKRKGTIVNKKANNDFVPSEVDDYPNCKIFVNPNKNAMLIEYNHEIGNSVFEIKKIIQDVLCKDICNMGYSIAIELITRTIDFWNYINDNNGKLTSVEFTLIRPNFLKGYPTATDYVNGFSGYNISSVTTRIENTDGNLSIPANNTFIDDAINYTAAGAGKWSISVKGKPKKKSSEDTPIYANIPTDIDSLSSDVIQELNDYFSSIDNIIKENKGINHEEKNL